MEVFTKNASLDTLAVTIQALHVSGKQMTLAVFRQLPVTKAYTDGGDLALLERWGIVRYAIKDEDSVWLVASADGKLYRCQANHALRSPDYFKRVLLDQIQKLANYKNALMIIVSNKKVHAAFNEAVSRLKAECPHKDWLLRHRWVNERTPKHPGGDLDMPYRWGDVTQEQLEESIVMQAAELEKSKRFDASRVEIMSLPQLFIAV